MHSACGERSAAFSTFVQAGQGASRDGKAASDRVVRPPAIALCSFMTSASLRALLTGLVDYAGLFPPAKLDMARAVAKYAQHRAGPHAYAISRFICPVSRLGEF